MIVYDHYTTLTSHETMTTLGVEYITATFNGNTRNDIHVIVVYEPPISVLSTLTCFNKTQHNQMNSIALCTLCNGFLIYINHNNERFSC